MRKKLLFKLYVDICFILAFNLKYRDLTSWIDSMISQVSSEELAKDVPGAEALLERNHVSVC